MNKKTYSQPSIDVVQLENANIICTSPITFSINDDVVDNYDAHEHEIDTRDSWGNQW